MPTGISNSRFLYFIGLLLPQSHSTPEPLNIGPVKPRSIARSGETTPMPTVLCFQILLSVNRFSYSSIFFGNLSIKLSMKSKRDPSRL